MLRSMMYVTTPSGWRRSRTPSASDPSSSRLASRRRAAPSSAVMRVPASTLRRMVSGTAMEPQLRDAVDDLARVRPDVELAQAGQLRLSQRVGDVPAEVGLVQGAALRM